MKAPDPCVQSETTNNYPPLNLTPRNGPDPKGKDAIPTIHFQVLLLLVSRGVIPTTATPSTQLFHGGPSENVAVYLNNPKQPCFNGCLVEQPFPSSKVWNHPIETTIYEWMFQVPGSNHQNKWLVLKVEMEGGKVPEINGDNRWRSYLAMLHPGKSTPGWLLNEQNKKFRTRGTRSEVARSRRYHSQVPSQKSTVYFSWVFLSKILFPLKGVKIFRWRRLGLEAENCY